MSFNRFLDQVIIYLVESSRFSDNIKSRRYLLKVEGPDLEKKNRKRWKSEHQMNDVMMIHTLMMITSNRQLIHKKKPFFWTGPNINRKKERQTDREAADTVIMFIFLCVWEAWNLILFKVYYYCCCCYLFSRFSNKKMFMFCFVKEVICFPFNHLSSHHHNIIKSTKRDKVMRIEDNFIDKKERSKRASVRVIFE